MYYPEAVSWYSNKDGSIDKVFTAQFKFKEDTCKFTLSQFIGAQSIDGKDVFEGDILKFPEDDHLYFVQQSDEGWGIFTAGGMQMGKPGLAAFMQIVGNTYENPSARIKTDET